MNYNIRSIFTLFFLIAISLLTLWRPVNVSAAGASLEFSTKKLELLKGEKKAVRLILDPKNQGVIGVDISLNYNPGSFKIVEVKDLMVFSHYPAVKIDNIKGTTIFSFSNFFGKTQSRRAEIAEIIIEGTEVRIDSPLSFNFTENSTTDTNVVINHGTDILDKVTGLSVTVKPLSIQNGSSSSSNQANSNSLDSTQTNNDQVSTQEIVKSQNELPGVLGSDDIKDTDNAQSEDKSNLNGLNNVLSSIDTALGKNSPTKNRWSLLYMITFICGIAAGGALFYIAHKLNSKNS